MKQIFTLKSLLLTLVLLCGLSAYAQTTVTFNATDYSSWSNSNEDREVTIDGITFSFTGGSTKTKYYDPQVRTYEGCIVKISSANNTITKIEYVYGISNKGCFKNVTPGTWDEDTKTWTGNANEISFTVGHSSGTSNGQVRINSITVTYQAAQTSNVPAPTLSDASGAAPLNVTITCPTSDTNYTYNVYYTTDGSAPKTSATKKSIEQTTNIEITNSSTVRAITYALDNTTAEGQWSNEVSKEYTITVPAPTFSLEEGTYNGTQSVTITVPQGLTLYYTTDGTDPLEASAPNESTTNVILPISSTTTVKAALADEYINFSNVVTKTYTIVNVTGIEITGSAAKTSYFSDEVFDPSGLVVNAINADNTKTDVTSDVTWTFNPATLSANVTEVVATASYAGFEASKPISVDVKAFVKCSATIDLTKTAQNTIATTETLEYAIPSIVTLTALKGNTDANNYWPGKSTYKSTRFYTNSVVTFTPASNCKIKTITCYATSNSYASVFASSTWSNATCSVSSDVVTITPTDGVNAVSVKIGGTCGFEKIVFEFDAIEPVDAANINAISGNGFYTINFAVQGVKLHNSVLYACTAEESVNKVVPNVANPTDLDTYEDRNFAEFSQRDWVALYGLEEGFVNKEIPVGFTVAYNNGTSIPVTEIGAGSEATAYTLNTYRAENILHGGYTNYADGDYKAYYVPVRNNEVANFKGLIKTEGDKRYLYSNNANGLPGVELVDCPSTVEDNSQNFTKIEGIYVDGKIIYTQFLEVMTSVEGVEADGVKVMGANGVITVAGEAVADIAVYTAGGQLVANTRAANASLNVAPGFYLVKVGNQVAKVAVK